MTYQEAVSAIKDSLPMHHSGLRQVCVNAQTLCREYFYFHQFTITYEGLKPVLVAVLETQFGNVCVDDRVEDMTFLDALERGMHDLPTERWSALG